MTGDGKLPEGIVPIALDAMGGDHGPDVIVPAALKAVAAGGLAIALVGDPAQIESTLDAQPDSPAKRLVQVVPSEGIVEEGESPVTAFRTKPKASVFVAAGAVKAGKAAGFVSMGSTGASIAAATVVFGTMEGIERGALGGPIIGYAPNSVIVDLGTNVDTRPSQLVDFGALGAVMARVIYDVDNPRVALLSVGAEEGKGDDLVKRTTELLKSSGLNFIGNVEASDLPAGKAEVILCDGFVGNVVLKLTEALGRAVVSQVREVLGEGVQTETLASAIFEKTNVLETLGGGPLLGVKGVAVVGHGAAGVDAVAGAIQTAKTVIERNLVEAQITELEKIRATVGS